MRTVAGKRVLERAKLLILATKVNSGGVARWGFGLLLAGSLMATAAAETPTYRWTDESGQVVYSQTPPPPGVEAEVIGAPPPPAEAPEVARQRLERQIDRFEMNRARRRESRRKAADEAARSEQVAKNCAAARHNLEIYEDAPPNRLYQDTTGVYRRFSAEERKAKAHAARQAIEQYCK